MSTITENATVVYQINAESFNRIAESFAMQKYASVEIDAKAAAQILGISYSTVVRWYQKGLLKACNTVRPGGVVKFILSEILAVNPAEIQRKYRQLNK